MSYETGIEKGSPMGRRDLSRHRIITAQDVEDAARAGVVELLLQPGAMLTPEAAEAVARHGLRLCGREGGDGWEALLNSAEAQPFKEEICAVGRKLWQRMYVDGNGGNISYRLRDDAVLCTPTLCSKADLTPADLCLVDLDGKQLAGGKARTSEILLHLEIYKAVPEAKAVVHCHPPHATAYAITGRVPPTCIIPEYEVFIGRVALSPYETPGTKKFAETVLPFVKTHNTVLLANHGIVCWADTVTHAEWYAEVVDTYCWTLMLAQQLGAPLSHIPAEKAEDLLAIKQRLGLPDARLAEESCPVCDMPERPGAITTIPNSGIAGGRSAAVTDELIAAVTEAVLRELEKKQRG